MSGSVHPKNSSGHYRVPGRLSFSDVDPAWQQRAFRVTPASESTCQAPKNSAQETRIKAPTKPQTNAVGIPIVNMASDRKHSVLKNTAAVFEISDNPNAKADAPLIEFDFFDEVDINETVIDAIANQVSVDPRLLKAIIYMESTHGWYDRANLALKEALKGLGQVYLSTLVPRSKSYRPMNLYYAEWKSLCEDLGISERDLIESPEKNIYLGATLLKRIQVRIENPNVEKIASIYNFLGAELVTDYGARVGVIYREELWKKNDFSKYIDIRGGYE
ncbi:hypothetical protein OPW39_08190 [Vibrio europaeus]|uniref:hypothetical protein n=1 Tax=Vibrio europaeus TaxID=300876 RepID=UPI00233F0E17|nr:hypothetical protein [Vibrio europaeus]MDC5868805.1 hypothetical protein [Vibrio europaeus]